MLEKIREKINNNKKIAGWILFGIIILGIILRTYQYHDWLYFKWDQARDANLVSEAIENGPAYLPLLGPRATKVGEDYLRLGPAFYYMQYLSGVIFNSTKPDVFAYPDTFFAVLTIPLLFLFLRLYFSRFNSLAATALYTFSFLVVQYSRFAWNPNAVPFWTLLTFYAFLKFQKEDLFKKKIIYLGIFTFAFSVATQYHFFAMFGLIGIVGAYLFFSLRIWDFKNFFTQLLASVSKIGSKQIIAYIFTFIIIFGLVYSPVIVSDTKTGWSNTKNFFGALSEKPRNDKTFGEKLIRNFREQSKNYTLIATSFWSRKGKKADPYPVVFGLLLMTTGVFLPLWQRRKTKNASKRNFLLLIPIWIGVFFLVTISTSYQLRPRYFSLVFPVPFIILAFWMSFLQKSKLRKGLFFSLVVFIAFLLMNIYGVAAWFKDNMIAQERDFPTDRNFILKKDDGITLGQIERVVNYMLENKKNNKLVFYSKTEYSLPIEYLLYQKNEDLEVYFVNESKDLIGCQNIYAINTVKGGWDSVSDKVKDYTGEPLETRQFGEMIIFELEVDPQEINELKDEIKKEEETKEVEEKEDSIEGEQEEDGKTERLFWKDVLK